VRYSGVPGVVGAVARIGDGEGRQGFHEAIRNAIWAYAGTGERDDAEFKAWLRDAIRVAPNALHSNVETPYCQDSYLQSSINGARAKLARREEVLPLPPFHAAPSGSLSEALNETALHTAAFFNTATYHSIELDEQARKKTQGAIHALRIGAGVGKTFTAAQEALLFIKNTSERVLWLCPDHKLAADACNLLRLLGINAVVWRGRTDDTKNGLATCHRMADVNEATSYGQSVDMAVCGKADAPGSQRCKWRNTCLYQLQKAEVETAQVVVAAHQSLFFGQGLGEFGAQVIDEAFWQAGLLTVRVDNRDVFPEVGIDGFAREVARQPVLRKRKKDQKDGDHRAPKVNVAATQELIALAAKVQAAIETLPAGSFLSKQALLAAGMEVVRVDLPTPNGRRIRFGHADAVRRAVKFEKQRHVFGAIRQGMTAEERQRGLERAKGNKDIPARVALLRAIRDLLEGDDDATGRIEIGARSVIVRSTREVLPKLAKLPTLILDATLPLEIVRAFYPSVALKADINPDAPHLRLTQVVGGFGKDALKANEKRVGELVDLARSATAAVVTYKAIEPAFFDAGLLTGHHGAIVGQNRFKDATTLFVIGRPLADAAATRDIALALFGKPIAAGVAAERETRGAIMRDGSSSSVAMRAFADPGMEAVRSAITDAAVVQAIARVRGVRREARNPVDVVFFGDVCLPMPVDNLVGWDQVAPDVMQRMACRGCVLPSPTDAARCYPDLFATEMAARLALGRSEADLGVIPLYGHYNRMTPKSLVHVRYKANGRGQQWRQAFVAADRVATFAEFVDVPGVKVEVVNAPASEPVAPFTDTAQDGVPAAVLYPNRAAVDYPADLFRVSGGSVTCARWPATFIMERGRVEPSNLLSQRIAQRAGRAVNCRVYADLSDLLAVRWLATELVAA